MKKYDETLLKEILEKLTRIEPPVKKFPVTPEDPAMSVYFVELSDVCYITTKSDAGRVETMFMTSSGKPYYSNLRLMTIEERLKEHPHFMRSSKFYIINLSKIRALKVSSARNLWFDGLDNPVINAVTSSYLAEFEKRLV